MYHNNRIIWKEYYSETLENKRLSAKMFDILKTINDKHFIKLLEIYCEMNTSELTQYKQGLKEFIVDAYIAKYYADNSVNPLYESTDYILDNFRELEKLFDKFSGNAITTKDIKWKNARFGHNGIIIIDPDLFSISTLPKQEIIRANKEQLLYLFISICINGTDKFKPEELRAELRIDLKERNVDSKTDITYELSRKLKHVKKPINYLTDIML